MILAAGALMSCACSAFNSTTEENIELTLPHWPPQDSCSQNYPELSRWYIQITQAEETRSFYTTQSHISVQTRKNRPFCVTARPLTLLFDDSESDYFKPAGYMYPFAENQPQNFLITWEQGYLANLMQKVFTKGFEEGFPPLEIEYLISTFNWNKAQEIIDKKLVADTELFYNPWLIPFSQLIEAITEHTFKSNLLNASGCTGITTSQLENSIIGSDPPLLSSFIPENFNLPQKKMFTVMKNSPIIIGDGNKFGIFINYKSAKNISLELIFLPIYIGDI